MYIKDMGNTSIIAQIVSFIIFWSLIAVTMTYFLKSIKAALLKENEDFRLYIDRIMRETRTDLDDIQAKIDLHKRSEQAKEDDYKLFARLGAK